MSLRLFDVFSSLNKTTKISDHVHITNEHYL